VRAVKNVHGGWGEGCYGAFQVHPNCPPSLGARVFPPHRLATRTAAGRTCVEGETGLNTRLGYHTTVAACTSRCAGSPFESSPALVFPSDLCLLSIDTSRQNHFERYRSTNLKTARTIPDPPLEKSHSDRPRTNNCPLFSIATFIDL